MAIRKSSISHGAVTLLLMALIGVVTILSGDRAVQIDKNTSRTIRVKVDGSQNTFGSPSWGATDSICGNPAANADTTVASINNAALTNANMITAPLSDATVNSAPTNTRRASLQYDIRSQFDILVLVTILGCAIFIELALELGITPERAHDLTSGDSKPKTNAERAFRFFSAVSLMLCLVNAAAITYAMRFNFLENEYFVLYNSALCFPAPTAPLSEIMSRPLYHGMFWTYAAFLIVRFGQKFFEALVEIISTYTPLDLQTPGNGDVTEPLITAGRRTTISGNAPVRDFSAVPMQQQKRFQSPSRHGSRQQQQQREYMHSDA